MCVVVNAPPLSSQPARQATPRAGGDEPSFATQLPRPCPDPSDLTNRPYTHKHTLPTASDQKWDRPLLPVTSRPVSASCVARGQEEAVAEHCGVGLGTKAAQVKMEWNAWVKACERRLDPLYIESNRPAGRLCLDLPIPSPSSHNPNNSHPPCGGWRGGLRVHAGPQGRPPGSGKSYPRGHWLIFVGLELQDGMGGPGGVNGWMGRASPTPLDL